VIKGKKVTSYKNIRHDMIHAGAEWVDEEVVVDGNFVTSRTPADLPAFSRELVNAVKNAKIAVKK
jgi:protease I